MRFPDFCWIDVALGGASKRNNLTDIRKFKLPADDTPDCYRTVFRYPDEFAEYFRQNGGTVKGYKGPVYADFFPIDVDDAEDVGRSLAQAREVLNVLRERYDLELAHVRCFFSGAKGFHIMIPDSVFGWEPCIEMPDVFKAMVQEMVGDLVRVDTSVYDRVRLFRLSNTINSKSGLYKIPLEPSELLQMSIEEILELAKHPRAVVITEEPELNGALARLYRSTLEAVRSKRVARLERKGALGAEVPKDQKLCYLTLSRGIGEGARNEAGLRLATHWRKMGFDEDMVSQMMLAWNARNNPPMDENEVMKIVHQAFSSDYDYGCWDHLLDAVCDQRCYLWRAKQKLPKTEGRVSVDRIYSMAEAAQKYVEYASKIETALIKTGFDKLDKQLRGIAPGEVMEIMARSGVGKTALLINIIRSVAVNQKVPILFFSLEQPVVQIWERAAQISSGRSGVEIEQWVRSGGESAAEIIQTVNRQFPGVYIVEEDFLTYEELVKFIHLATEQKIGKKPGLVAIDYLGRMQGNARSAYEITSQLAKQMKHLAKEMDLPLIYLHQTSRAGKDGSEEITLDMGRDSGVTEEAADFVIALWRPDMKNPGQAAQKDTETLMLRVLKNRKGPVGEYKLTFAKKQLWIGDRNLAAV